MHSFS